MKYHLLRNNIESGPFTKDELIHQGVKLSDQIKLEGDEHWHSPNHIEELKDAMAHAAKPKYKFTADKKLIEIKNEEHTPSSAGPDESATPTPFKRQPSAIPKKRTSTEAPVEPHLHKDPKIETSPFVQKQTLHNIENAPSLEKKIKTRPITVKNNYVKEQSSRTNLFKEFLLPIFILGGVGVLAWWGYHKFTNNDASVQNLLQQAPKDTIVQQKATIDSSKKLFEKIAAKAPEHKKLDSATLIAREEAKRIKNEAYQDSVRKAHPALTKTDSETSGTIAPTSTQKNIPTTPPADTQKEKEPASTKRAVVKEESPKKKVATKKASSIGDFINLSLNKVPTTEVRGIKLKVENISNQNLNIAVIEVKYFDPNGNFIKGETLTANNIGAGKTVTIRIPNSKESSKITYKTSLISGDNVYLMGQ